MNNKKEYRMILVVIINVIESEWAVLLEIKLSQALTKEIFCFTYNSNRKLSLKERENGKNM